MTDPYQHGESEASAALTGFWTGVFDTEDLTFEATPFHAFLNEEGGAVIGEMVEPNGFSPDPVAELFASVEGWRDREEIEFVKTYEDAMGAGFAVRFEGVVDEGRDSIRGVWSLLQPCKRAAGIALSGPFVMNRVTAEITTSSETASNRRRSF